MSKIMKFTALVLVAGALGAQIGHAAMDPQSAIIQDFQKRVAAYLQLRKNIESDLGRM